MSEPKDYIERMDNWLNQVFTTALKISFQNPSLALFILRSTLRLHKAARSRRSWERRGIHVPPYLIASITNGCNLHCKGCYARAHHRPTAPELPVSRWAELFREANELGISVIMLAGGEPLTRPEILELTRDYPEIIFPVFTNGLLIDQNLLTELRRRKNIVPVISIEGFKAETDSRRGTGVFDHVRQAIMAVKQSGLFFGVSITVTRENFDNVTSEQFIGDLTASGSRLFIFVEYTPVEAGTEDLILTPEQKTALARAMQIFPTRYRGVFTAFPGDEEAYGGCLAAGRGFVHVSAEGNLEPCPFAPYSDTNLEHLSLKEALSSELLQAIRDQHERLKETQGGCALWENREWVGELMKRHEARGMRHENVGDSMKS